MNAPLYKFGVFGDEASLIVAFAIGIGFGWFLERAGFGNARKLMAQFYLTDMTVFKVMFSAIVVAMLGIVIAGGLLLSEPLSSQLILALVLVGAQSDGQWRFPQQDSVPEKFSRAITCFEDKRFFSHPGIDPLAIGRALLLNLKLIDQGQVVLDGIFHRDNIDIGVIDGRERCIQSCGLSASRGAGDQDQAVGQLQQLAQRVTAGRQHAADLLLHRNQVGPDGIEELTQGAGAGSAHDRGDILTSAAR